MVRICEVLLQQMIPTLIIPVRLWLILKLLSHMHDVCQRGDITLHAIPPPQGNGSAWLIM